MRLIVVGPGRAGGAIALAASAAHHEVVGLLARHPVDLPFPQLEWETPLPHTDLLVVAVVDDAINTVAQRLVSIVSGSVQAIHLSGFTSIVALQPLAAAGLRIGSFHPLQTLPTPTVGAEALAGAYVAITGDKTESLFGFAESLGMRPFALADADKAAYHAGAAAASNYVVTTLALAADLFAEAGVPFAALQPLTESIVANVFKLGPVAALTGPVARGDRSTVAGQLMAAQRAGVGDDFVTLAKITAHRAGTQDRLGGLW